MSDARHVYVLGAGFSRAVSEASPLAEDLGRQALEVAKQADPGLFEGVPPLGDQYPFEVWLSLLAEDQPQLNEPANRKNAARFATMSQAVVSVLRAAQAEALATDPPGWLYEFLSALHEDGSVVITLNYDTLFESAVASMHLGSGQMSAPRPAWRGTAHHELSPARVTVADILQDRPPRASAVGPPAGSCSFRLLKLHGSLDWSWTPGDITGASFVRASMVGMFGHGSASFGEAAGREPFIVPPLAIKSSYYANPLTRQLWREAFIELSNATRVTLIGYSLPQTDIVVGGMLSDALSGNESPIEIVNPDANGVRDRIAALPGVADRHAVIAIGTDACVPSYVDALLEELSLQTISRLSVLKPISRPEDPDPILVSWSSGGAATNHTVIDIERQTDGTLLLHLVPGMDTPARSRPTTQELVDAVSGAARLVIQTQEGQRRVVIGFTSSDFQNPNARHVVWLNPAGQLEVSA